jgi:hypothetical protein
VLSIGRFKTEDEAIALANDTTYGLGAGLHSSDANQCMRVSGALEAGTVWVNQYNMLNNNVPFGGKRQSGIGACCDFLFDGSLIHLHDACIILQVENLAATLWTSTHRSKPSIGISEKSWTGRCKTF